MSPVTEVRNGHSQRTPDADVVHIVAVVLATRDGNECGTDEGCQAKQRAAQVAAPDSVVEDVQLPGKEESEEAEASK